MYNVIVNISEIKTEEKLNVSVMSINYSNVNFFLSNWLFYYLAILSGHIYKQIWLFWYIEKWMYVVFILYHIHSFFNVPKKPNLLINVTGWSTTTYNLRSNTNSTIIEFPNWLVHVQCVRRSMETHSGQDTISLGKEVSSY
jgi:hypothetical protein